MPTHSVIAKEKQEIFQHHVIYSGVLKISCVIWFKSGYVNKKYAYFHKKY